MLTPEQAAVVARALVDAVRYRRERAASWCHDCQDHPAGACQDHLDDLDAASAYAEAARQLQAAGDVEAGDARRVREIRELLFGCDWEADDRQYALEAIERIVEDQ